MGVTPKNLLGSQSNCKNSPKRLKITQLSKRSENRKIFQMKVRDAIKKGKKQKYGTLSQKVGGGPDRIPNFSKFSNGTLRGRMEGVPMAMSQVQHTNFV